MLPGKIRIVTWERSPVAHPDIIKDIAEIDLVPKKDGTLGVATSRLLLAAIETGSYVTIEKNFD